MKKAFCIWLFCMAFAIANAQRVPMYESQTRTGPPPAAGASPRLTMKSIVSKTPGHFTGSDWRQLIDSTWGEGTSTSVKLQVFDSFWQDVDQRWGGFPNLDINWDSLRNAFYPQVAAGVSRGRFYGILSRLTRALQEWHAYMQDLGIDLDMGMNYLDQAEYPNLPSFRYKPGIPLLLLVPHFRSHFGAGVTSLGDSLALVYSVSPDHPLNLQPGDIILGYDGKPWKQLVNELFEAELPMLEGGPLGATTQAANHCITMTAGLNWGLFDTIDVLKYPTNDTVHFSTSLLDTLSPPYFIATEQLPVAGVPFPNLADNILVSRGIVEGTRIGYVYALDWWGGPYGDTRGHFGQAIDNLMHGHDLRGIVLDFRTNFGGYPEYANEGFKHLFNLDPTNNYARAFRVGGGGHFSFSIRTAAGTNFFTPTPELFEHPIAVLIGPNCGSAGDYNAFRLRFHPMVRFFGKPAAGAYTDLDIDPFTLYSPYRWRVDPGCVYSNVNNEAYMIHRAFPVDEEVWLTREGVAAGRDDVVERALEWIKNLSYAHGVRLARVSLDTVRVTARVQNRLAHNVSVMALLKDGAGGAIDSLTLFDDGLHSDGTAGDTLYGGLFVPNADNVLHAWIRVNDLTAATSRILPDAASLVFTRGALITVDSAEVYPGLIPDSIEFYDIPFCVRNIGWAPDSLTMRVESPTSIPDSSAILIPDAFSLAPGDSEIVTLRIRTGPYDRWRPYTVFAIVHSLTGYGQTYFSKGIHFTVITGVDDGDPFDLPSTFALGQNYPNPFNPTTFVTYQLPTGCDVRLTVSDVLGREVRVMVDEQKAPGRYQVGFDGSGLSSGVYLYRMQAGAFNQTKRMIVLK